MADSAIYLFLDESGDFLEAGDEQSSNRGGFSSQLAGFFTTAELPENLGQDAVVRLLRAAKLEQQSIKSSELRREDKCTLAPVLCELLEEKGWHPVRLTNLERVALGGRTVGGDREVTGEGRRARTWGARVGVWGRGE